MNDTLLQSIANDLVLRQRLAKLMALRCFRNTLLEDFHAGKMPASVAGDYSDVTVVTPARSIPWAELSRISDDEMRSLMIDVVNQCYRFLSELSGSNGAATIEKLKARDPLPQWLDPT